MDLTARAIGAEISPSSTITRLAVRQYPSKFQPPNSESNPVILFESEHRFIRKSNPREILIYTDGACLGNGQNNPRGGCAFYFRRSAYTEDGELAFAGTICRRLEKRGPSGDLHKETSNRAELRAVIAALQFRDWSTDCNRSWRSVVIATDSEYVTIGATERIQRWENEGWILAGGYGKVKNTDLWKLLLLEIRALLNKGVNVSFWRIPREWNEKADKYAKVAAGFPDNMQYERMIADGLAGTKHERILYVNM